MGIEKLQVRRRVPAQQLFNAGAPEQLFIFVKTGTIVQITHHDHTVMRLEKVENPLAHPLAFGQLLLAVFNRDALHLFRCRGPMRRLGFCMDPDHAERHAARRARRDLERGLVEGDQIGLAIMIQIKRKTLIKARGLTIAAALRIMRKGQDIGIIKHGDFLLGAIPEPQKPLAAAQFVAGGKRLQHRHGPTLGSVVGGLDNHHRVRIQCGKDDPQCCQLLGAGDMIARRPVRIFQQPPMLVEQGVEPFDVIGGNAKRLHVGTFALISSQALFTAISRCSAMRIASAGRPRAAIPSG